MQKINWIAFIGLPNAGKSTLVNLLVGEKISIVTPKAQTTRNSLKGIRVEKDVQLVFIDTPGIFDAKTASEKLMVKLAWQQLEHSDQIAVMVDAKKAFDPKNLEMIRKLPKRNYVYNLIINKIDKISKPELLKIAAELNEICNFQNTFMISALKNIAVDALFKYFIESSRNGMWFFDEDEITTAPAHFMVTEIVREKIFFNTHNELPYNAHVEIVNWEKKEDITVININILVKSNSHKKIIIGKQGALLKKIGMQARKDIEDILKHKLFLDIHIKVSRLDDRVVAKHLNAY